MAAQTDCFFVRRKTGTPVGPFSEQVIATMLRKGSLDGSEEISLDRKIWWPVKEFAHRGPQPAPAGADVDAFLSGGTEVLAPSNGRMVMQSPSVSIGGGDSGSSEEDLYGGFGARSDEPRRRERTAGGVGPPAMLPVQHNGSGNGRFVMPAATPAQNAHESPPGMAALELDADDLIPLELAPLEATGSHATAASRRSAPGGANGRAASGDAAPVAMLLSDEHSRAYPHEEAPGSVPLLPTIRPDIVGPGSDAEGGGSRVTAQAPATRHRTMSAVRQRPTAPVPKFSARRKLIVAGSGAATLVIAAAAFVALGGRNLLFGEPAVAAVLGPAAAAIDEDHFPAYEQGARLLLDAAASRPTSVKLRAVAAELLASSVVLRRAERSRIGRAEAILADIGGAPDSLPEVARARGWVALAKGNWKEAGRLATAVATGSDAQPLLAGWVQLGAGKPAAAVKIFEAAASAPKARIALRYGLARAQEEAGLPAALPSYQAVVAHAKSHFGAGLAVIKASQFPPATRLTLAEALIAKQAADASRTELADAHVVVGRAARLLGKIDESDAAYKRALSIDASDPAALVATGEALLEQGKIKEAVAKFETAAPNAPLVPVAASIQDLRFAMAAALIERGKAKPGLELLDQARGPNVLLTDPRALFWRARAAELASPPDLVSARRGYEETLKADPRFVPATLQLAALLVQQRRGADGLAVLRRAEAAGAPAAALQLALGEAFLASGDVQRATKTFREALAGNPKLATARLGLASALEAAGQADAARGELDTLLVQAPETPGLRQHMAELLVSQGRKDQALVTYRAEIAAGKASPPLKMAAAKLALDLGQADVARQIAEGIVADAPETAGALVLLGRIRRASGDLRGAVTELRRALAFESTPELHFEYGRALVETGNIEEALGELEQAPSLPAAVIERARIFLRRGDAERAVGPLEGAVKQAPGSADGWLLLGNAYDRLGTPGKAESAWKSALKADPSGPEAHYRLGRLLMDQGQSGAALAQLRLAAPRVPPGGTWTADFYFQLGFAEKARGNRPAAAVALRKYLAIAPSDAPSRHEVEQQLGNLN